MISSPEPMSLGSPSQSPPNGAQFLPSYLLGDLNPANSPNQLLGNRNQPFQNSKYWQNSSSPPRSLQQQSAMGQPQMPQCSLSRANSTRAPYSPFELNNKPNSILKQEPDSNYPYQSNMLNNHHHHNHLHNPYMYQSANNSAFNSPHHDRSIASSTMLGGPSGGGGLGGPSERLPQHASLQQTSLLNQQTQQSSGGIPGAPPVNRLIDMLNKPTFGLSPGLTPNDRNRFGASEQQQQQQQSLSDTPGGQDLLYTPNNYGNVSSRMSPPSPTQIDPFYKHGESIKVDDKLDETWITLFGFPSSATSYVLQEFSVYGQIVKHVPSNQGNWLHIKYQSKLQAQKALSKSGKVLANSLMIGVMPCIDKEIMKSSSSTSTQDSPANLINQSTAPSMTRNFSASTHGTRLDRTQSLRTNVRPLGSFNRNIENISPQVDDPKLPKKNTNVISKAMEFMFGW